MDQRKLMDNANTITDMAKVEIKNLRKLDEISCIIENSQELEIGLGTMYCTYIHTADFIKKVLSVYIHSKATIYLSLSAQVTESTFFMKSPV